MTEVPPGSTPVDRLGPGSRIREWKVERFLARGAFGQVFAATRDSWREEPSRALKVFDPILSSSARSALVTEFDLLRDVRHPHLLAGEDAFDIDDGPLAGCVVFVMELADVDLASLVAREGTPSPGAVAAVGAQLADGLAALHVAGHLHGDVKPENALRAGGLWKLGDFGVSASLQGSYARPIGATLDFRPPEVARPEAAGRVHRSADVWALGTTLWLVGAGRHPFVGADAAVRHAAVLRGERQPAPDLDLALADLIDRRCLVPDPHIRASAADVAVELRQLAQLDGAPPPGPMAGSDGGRGARGVATTVADGEETTARADAGPTHPARPLVGPPPTRPPGPLVGQEVPAGARPAPPWPGGAGPGGEPSPVPAAAQDPGRPGDKDTATGAAGPLLGLVAGGVVAAVVAEAASLVATVAPGGLGVRRTAYGLLTVVVLAGVAVVVRARVRQAWGPMALPSAVLGALMVLAVATAFLFGAM